MVKNTSLRHALDAWTSTLDRMQDSLTDLLGRVASPEWTQPERAERTQFAPFDRRLADWENCVQQMEEEVREAEAASRDEIAELQPRKTKIAESRERLTEAVNSPQQQ